ncbi:MAG: MmcQ/YjbR family DNA-binding protein [Sciscionella sp.]|nr:MmcQ/YjbR family DNA-binding protein [Sciscionella sp.]
MVDPKEYALGKPGAVRDEPWDGDVVAKVGGKIFAFLGDNGIGVKHASKEEAEEWRQRYPNNVTMMAYIGRHGWNTVKLDGTIPDEEIIELLDVSYDSVVAKLPKRLRPEK